MKVDFKWDKDFKDKWDTKFSEAQKVVDSEVIRLSDPYVPFQTGILKKSGILGTKIGSGEVVYNAPYARYLYYGKLMIGTAPKVLTEEPLEYHGAPRRGAYWFERMKEDKKEQILRMTAKSLKGGKE